jgi:hypothetical protein
MPRKTSKREERLEEIRHRLEFHKTHPDIPERYRCSGRSTSLQSPPEPPPESYAARQIKDHAVEDIEFLLNEISRLKRIISKREDDDLKCEQDDRILEFTKKTLEMCRKKK